MTTRHLTRDEIQYAARTVKRGGLVVFPTETVYGLGADAENDDACREVFRAKGRPVDNPLIVHVADVAMAARVAASVPAAAEVLAEAFWPGPLTLVLQKAPTIAEAATAGLDTVAVRCPDHEVARALIRESGLPIAAPSANRSGRPSPTNFAMAVREMDGRVDAIIDGGRCRWGIESTVLRIAEDGAHILRPGSVTAEMIASVLGSSVSLQRDDRAPSPGVRHAHYQPDAPVYLANTLIVDSVRRLADEKRVGVICIACHDDLEGLDDVVVRRVESIEDYAHHLYRALWELDEAGCCAIVAELPPPGGIGDALRDRITRAAGGRWLPG